jgi:hypothetical protein
MAVAALVTIAVWMVLVGAAPLLRARHALLDDGRRGIGIDDHAPGLVA